MDNAPPWCDDSRMPSTLVQDIASFATAAGAAFVGLQVQGARRQLRDQFEQKFVDRYNRIIARVPLTVILGEEENVTDAKAQRAFYDYYELCEEEVYYRKLGRVSKATWRDWWYGISHNFQHQAFYAAWQNLSNESAPEVPGPSNPFRQFEHLRDAVKEAKTRRTSYDPRISWLRRAITRPAKELDKHRHNESGQVGETEPTVST